MVNKTSAMYLWCGIGDRPRAWLDWLPWAEYCYNTSNHTALHTTPFEVVYGWPPPALLPYTTGSARTDTVPDSFLADVRDWLLQAQEYTKKNYNGITGP